MFFQSILPLSLHEIATKMQWPEEGLHICDGDKESMIKAVAPLEKAQAGDISFFDNPKYKDHLKAFQGSVVILREKERVHLPSHVSAIVMKEPYMAWGQLLQCLYPNALQVAKPSLKATQDEDCLIEEGAEISPTAIIGRHVEIGKGSYIGPNVVIGDHVKIGRDCHISANVTIIAALIGDRVIIHNNCGIGQDGFGFAMGKSHLKIPQIGRVIIQDDVEIGAGTMVDRGAIGDTVIGQGTKIDNLVQIAHNVEIGMHCVIAALVGIAGSVKIGNYVSIGGQVGIAGHLKIGDQARIGAQAGVMTNMPDGETWLGSPAQAVQKTMREIAVLRKLSSPRKDVIK